MKYAIVYNSKTGNTRLLAETLQKVLPQADCVYFGTPNDAALSADRLYIGFWVDKGSCDDAVSDFLTKLQGKEVFLFGTAGFGKEPAYFETILKKVSQNLAPGNTLIGTYMCQGKMPISVRERYEQMLAAPNPAPNLHALIENFDQALSHPDEADLAKLAETILHL